MRRYLTVVGCFLFAAWGPTRTFAVESPPPLQVEKTDDVVVTETILAPRSASETVRDRAVLQTAPHRSADELIAVVPGAFVTQHSGEGKAYQIFYRGFDAVHGQDVEITAGGVPVNDVSNIHGQGYADLHFLPIEIVQSLRALPGTYDPRQGDFAVAGSLHFDLGYDRPGITAKVQGGRFGARRLFLAYRPTNTGPDTFGAVEIYTTDGFGPARAAQRASAIGQMLVDLGAQTDLRVLASAYTGHFASAGVLPLTDIESGNIDRFASLDATQGGDASRTQLLTELRRPGRDERLTLSSFVVLRGFRLRQNFTGFLTDANGDGEQQINDSIVAGARGAYQRRLSLFSPEDSLEVGLAVRTDWITQSQRRLASVDDQVNAVSVDARVRAHDVGGYVDLALHPWSRLTLRGGVRVDGLGYFAQDQGGKAAGQARSSQGQHIGNKASADVLIGWGLRSTVSYGEGFRSPQARSLADAESTPFTRVRSAELGLRLDTRAVAATLAAFQTRLSDDLVFDQATGRNERVPATHRTGASADLRVWLSTWAAITSNATYTRAVFRAGDAAHSVGSLVPYAPQLVARTDLALTPRLGHLWGRAIEGHFGLGLSWLARRPLPYGEWGHDIFLADARAEAQVGAVTAGLELFNLFGTRWYDGEFVYASRWNPGQGAALVPQRHVTVGAPRSWLATLALHL